LNLLLHVITFMLRSRQVHYLYYIILYAAIFLIDILLSVGNFKDFCESKVLTHVSEYDKQVWDLMRVIRFESNAREELLKYLGFDSASIAAAAQRLASAHAPPPPSESSLSSLAPPVAAMESMSVISAEETADFFGGAPPAAAATPEVTVEKVAANISPAPLAPTPSELSASVKAISAEMLLTAISGEKFEPSIRSALVVGNFSAAVDYCIEAGLMAEALLLAQCGEAGLWIRTQDMFFRKLGQRYPFLNYLHAVINSNLMNLVLKSDLKIWKETLAILSTYGKSDEFPALCEVTKHLPLSYDFISSFHGYNLYQALAVRLQNELGDGRSATLCYMCAGNVVRTVAFWVQELKTANMEM